MNKNNKLKELEIQRHKTKVLNQIKGLQTKDNPFNNVSFEILKEILLNHIDLFIKNKAIDLKNTIISYKNDIDKDKNLRGASYYIDYINKQQKEYAIQKFGSVENYTMSILSKDYNKVDEEEISEQYYTIWFGRNQYTFRKVTLEEYDKILKKEKLKGLQNIIVYDESIDYIDFPKWAINKKEELKKEYNNILFTFFDKNHLLFAKNISGDISTKILQGTLYYSNDTNKMYVIYNKTY